MLLAWCLMVFQEVFQIALPLEVQLGILAGACAISTKLFVRGYTIWWLLDIALALLLGFPYRISHLCSAVCLSLFLHAFTTRFTRKKLSPEEKERLTIPLLILCGALIVMDIVAVSCIYPRMPAEFSEQLLACVMLEGDKGVECYPVIGTGDFAFGCFLMLLTNASVLAVVVPFFLATALYMCAPFHFSFFPFLTLFVPFQLLFFVVERKIKTFASAFTAKRRHLQMEK